MNVGEKVLCVGAWQDSDFMQREIVMSTVMVWGVRDWKIASVTIRVHARGKIIIKTGIIRKKVVGREFDNNEFWLLRVITHTLKKIEQLLLWICVPVGEVGAIVKSMI